MELNAIESLVKELIPDHAEPNNTYDAVVSQIDNDGTVWVNVAGGTIDTPTASKSSEVEVGDSVTVEWRNNKLYIAGNASNPSAGVIRVADVEETASTALDTANTAILNAEEAQEAATRYITYIDEEHGIRVHDGSHMNDFVNVNSNGVELFKDSNSVAKFGNSARIGTETDASITIKNSSIVGVGSNRKSFFKFADGTGDLETDCDDFVVSDTPYGNIPHSSSSGLTKEIQNEPTDPLIILHTEYFEEDGNTADLAQLQFTYGQSESKSKTKAVTISGVTYNVTLYATYDGDLTFSNIYMTSSIGDPQFHVNIGIYYFCIIKAPSYVLGVGEANGGYSFAEGFDAVANGNYSYALGLGTIATGDDQFVIGRYNVEDEDDEFAFIIGNGGVDVHGVPDRSNLMTVDWSGNLDLNPYAKYKVGGVPLAPSDLGEADYVVEQGTSGGWYYRKWDSGRLDADRVWNVGQVTLNTAEGTTHRVSADLTIPTPSMMIGGTVEASYVGNSSNSPSFIEKTTNNKLRIAKVITSNVTLQNVTIALRLVGGTWK